MPWFHLKLITRIVLLVVGFNIKFENWCQLYIHIDEALSIVEYKQWQQVLKGGKRSQQFTEVLSYISEADYTLIST